MVASNGSNEVMGVHAINTVANSVQLALAQSLLAGIAKLAVGLTNTVTGTAPPPPTQYLHLGANGWTAAAAPSCPTGPNIVVFVPGMFSNVSQSFPGDPSATPNVAQSIVNQDGYSDAVGFDYNFPQDITGNGNLLASYLGFLANCPGVQHIDIQAHSEGTIVAGEAVCAAAATQPKLRNFVALGGIFLGTPAADVIEAAGQAVASSPDPGSSLFANWPLPVVLPLGVASESDLAAAPFAKQLQTVSAILPVLRQCLGALPKNITTYTACGTKPMYVLLLEWAIGMSGIQSDGLVPLTSCQGLPGSIPLGPFNNVDHTHLQGDPGVQDAVAQAVNPGNLPVVPPNSETWTGSMGGTQCGHGTQGVTAACDPQVGSWSFSYSLSLTCATSVVAALNGGGTTCSGTAAGGESVASQPPQPSTGPPTAEVLQPSNVASLSLPQSLATIGEIVIGGDANINCIIAPTGGPPSCRGFLYTLNPTDITSGQITGTVAGYSSTNGTQFTLTKK
jgi:hypothetical protein